MQKLHEPRQRLYKKYVDVLTVIDVYKRQEKLSTVIQF